MNTKDISQTLHFKAPPIEVYNCIMDAKKHSKFTNSKVEIEDKVDTKFSAYDGYITGENKELEPGKKIVQSWRGTEDDWPEDHYSEVVFEFSETEDGGTELNFTHTGIPESKAESLDQGWHDHYWTPMKEMLEG